jgi:DNA-binding NarL/FixJ family response regulator
MLRSSIDVWIVEDNDVQRDSLVSLLSEVTDMHCGGAFADCESMLDRLVRSSRGVGPDVLLMDVELQGVSKTPRMNGIEGATRAKQLRPAVSIVMLTVRDEADTVYAAMGSGACGYLVKPPAIDEVVAGIREAHRGGMCMSPPVARKVIAFFQGHSLPVRTHELTDREREILRHMERGHRQKEIAEALFLSRHTIDSHLRNIYDKLHVNSAAEAVGKAIREREI